MEEGCVLHQYVDRAGVLTIGTGHAIKSGETFPRTITMAEADAILRADLRDAESAVNRMVNVPLNENQFSAVVSFVFNVGTGAFYGSTLLKVINAGQLDQVRPHFLEWCKRRDPDTGKLIVDAGLQMRRAKEAALFETPVAPDSTDVASTMNQVYATAAQIVASVIDPMGATAPEES